MIINTEIQTNNKLKIQVKCPFCGKHSYLSKEVDQNSFMKYINGNELIQRCFPMLSKEDREMLMTGMCLSCQETTFKDEE